uniref:Uncharacterized protein n=1 Tax=Hucho hucho TaxID=62062 RepID=A0A4W5M2B5_9TELE
MGMATSRLRCVCVLGAAYFSLQVLYARRKYLVSPPSTFGPPEFEKVFRAHCPLYKISLEIHGIIL